MTLREHPQGPWIPTADDPLRGVAENTRKLYAAIMAEPGIGAAEAGRRAGIKQPDGYISTLIGRGVVEVRRSAERGYYYNQCWPVPR